MGGVAVDSEIYRLTAEQYHLLIESGAFDEKSRVELIDGLLLDMSPKTPAHERIIRVARRNASFAAVDARALRHRVGAPLSLGDSEPSRISLVFDARRRSSRTIPRPRPSWSRWRCRRGRAICKVKPRLYAGAGVPVYWVIDVERRARGPAHPSPQGDEYGRVEIVTELTAPHLGLEPIAVADVLG